MRETFRQSGSFIFCFYFVQRCRLGNAWLSAIRWYLWNPPTLRAWKIATAKIRSSTDRKNITILLLLIYIYIYYCFCSVQKINILCDTFKFPNMRSNFVLISQHKRTHEQPEQTQFWLKKHCSHLGFPASYYELPSFSRPSAVRLFCYHY